MRRLTSLLTARVPLAIVVVALVAIGGGSATAATLITGKQIKNSSVTGADIRNRSLTAADFSGALPSDRAADGKDGAPGSKGDSGAPGGQGTQGVAGTPGAQGDAGPTGAPGSPGTPGAQGDAGPTGAPGSLGAPGADGSTGPAGRDGVDAFGTVAYRQGGPFDNPDDGLNGGYADCPKGMVAIGGGAFGDAERAGQTVNASGPFSSNGTPTPGRWYVWMSNKSGEDAAFDVHVVCAAATEIE